MTRWAIWTLAAAALRTPRVLEELREDFSGLPELLGEPPPVPLGAVGPVAPAPVPRPQLDLFG